METGAASQEVANPFAALSEAADFKSVAGASYGRFGYD